MGYNIEKVYIQNNQFVYKGDKLMQIDPRDYQLKVAQANSKVIQAKRQLAIVQKAQSSLDTSTSITNRYT